MASIGIYSLNFWGVNSHSSPTKPGTESQVLHGTVTWKRLFLWSTSRDFLTKNWFSFSNREFFVGGYPNTQLKMELSCFFLIFEGRSLISMWFFVGVEHGVVFLWICFDSRCWFRSIFIWMIDVAALIALNMPKCVFFIREVWSFSCHDISFVWGKNFGTSVPSMIWGLQKVTNQKACNIWHTALGIPYIPNRPFELIVGD